MRIEAALSCLILLGCVSATYRLKEGEDYGFAGDDGTVWVRGPWEVIHPSKDIDEVIDQLCPVVMQLPGAQLGDYGQEYCGVIYPFEDGFYYASAPSPLKKTELVGASKAKSCFVPLIIRDPRGIVQEPTADFHGHPWLNSPLSKEDRLQSRQWYRMRIQFDTNCRVQKLVPHVGEDRPGEVYERLGKSWRLVGYILPEDKVSGRVTPARN